MVKTLSYKIYIRNRPMEELTNEELADWRAEVGRKMSRVFSDYYSQHIEEYEKIKGLSVPEESEVGMADPIKKGDTNVLSETGKDTETAP